MKQSRGLGHVPHQQQPRTIAGCGWCVAAHLLLPPPAIGRSPLPGMSVRKRTFQSPEQVPAPTLQKLLKPSVYTPVPPPAAFRYLGRHACEAAMCGCSFVVRVERTRTSLPGRLACSRVVSGCHSPAVAPLQVKALATAQEGGGSMWVVCLIEGAPECRDSLKS